MGRGLEVPSGAASPTHRSASACDSTVAMHTTTATGSGSAASAARVWDSAMGGDPRTAQAPFVHETGGDPRTGHASFKNETGGDPKTDLHVPSGGEVKTDQFVPSGGEVKTDHSTLDAQMTCLVGDTDDSLRPGRLATQTATPDPPACTESAISRPEDADGFTMTNFPAVPDGFPSSSQGCKSRDELPRSGVIHQVESGSMNSISDDTSTVFSGDFHVGEKSERLRQSDFGVQIVPASRSPSELSAHQMGLPLAGTVRLKSEPISIDPIPTLSTIVYFRSRALAQVQVFWPSSRVSSTGRNLQGEYCGCSEG